VTERPQIDWDAVTAEATDLLSRYIQVDTSNPPGNEEAACRFLEEVLRSEGIAAIDLYDASDAESQGRMNLRARLSGDGSKRPLILLNHTDVVPVEAQYWEVPPFSGAVIDGSIWGRGALDMKSLAVMELMAFLLVERLGLPLKRDLVFLACADEEAGSKYGVDWLDQHHPEALDAEYVINEGGRGHTELLGIRRPAFLCGVAEKGPLWLILRAEGRPGHGSVPHRNNPLDRLVRALHRILEWERPIRLTPAHVEYLRRLERSGFIPDTSEETLRRLAAEDDVMRSTLTDSVSITMARAGIKHNVIPAVAEASLDCRLLPGTDPQAFIAELRTVIDDPRVNIEQVMESHAPPSPHDTELFRVMEDVLREHVEEAVVVPSVATGFTDSRVFRRRGAVAYGLTPVLLDGHEAATVHGHNERISIDNLRLGCQVMFEVVCRMAC
jgi:acetylornithine deacetylase/succinyl-diaminopimelate desuccinylase-like protein